MKGTLNIAVFVLLALMSSVQPAHADFLDWMQEWSGPGPFREGGNGLFTWCRKDFSVERESEQNHNPCIFFDVRRLVAQDNDNFPVKVTATTVDIGPTWRLRRPIEIGVGAGFMVATGDETAVRPILTVPRIAVQPFVLAGYLFKKNDASMFNVDSKKSRLWHIVKFYVRGSFIAGPLTGEDLGVSGSSYDRTFEYVVSRGFYIDIAEAFFPRLTN